MESTGGLPLRELMAAFQGPAGDGPVRITVAPAGLDVAVRHVAIVDPEEEPHALPGDLVLAVGLRGRAVLSAIRAAGAGGAAAVAAKADGAVLREAAARAGVALLAVRPEARWEQVDGLAREALAEPPEPRGDDGGEGGDLFSLAQTTALLTGGGVSIEDTANRVLAYSRASGNDQPDELRRLSILGWQGPEEYLARLRDWGVFHRLRTTDTVVAVDERPDLGIRRRLAVGVHAGGRPLGTIWVQEGGRPLAARADEVLRGAARVAALHLARRRDRPPGEALAARETVAALLDGRGAVRRAAAHLGLDPARPVLVAAFALEDGTGGGLGGGFGDGPDGGAGVRSGEAGGDVSRGPVDATAVTGTAGTAGVTGTAGSAGMAGSAGTTGMADGAGAVGSGARAGSPGPANTADSNAVDTNAVDTEGLAGPADLVHRIGAVGSGARAGSPGPVGPGGTGGARVPAGTGAPGGAGVPAGPEELELARAELAGLVSVYAAARHSSARVARVGARLYVLFPAPPSEAVVTGWVRGIVDAAAAHLRLGVRAGVGEVARRLGAAPESRAGADRVLDAMAAGTVPAGVAALAEVRPRVLTGEVLALLAGAPHIRDPRIEALVAHDAAHGTRYAASVLAWLDGFGDVRSAARGLHVHPNTLRYRVRRAGELTGLDLSDPGTRLLAALLLRR